VRCIGTSSPRWGTGAKVRVKATIGGESMWRLRLIDAGGTPWGGQSFVAHFGLGDATMVDTLRIEWTSGIVQELRDVMPRQILTVTEPPRIEVTGTARFRIGSWLGMAFDIQSSPDLRAWQTIAGVTNLTGQLHFDDCESPDSATRFYRAVMSRP
jgi:hypothetical protein